MDDCAQPSLDNARLPVVGLGRVGPPLAAAFGVLRDTVGFDIDTGCVEELHAGIDRTGETDCVGSALFNAKGALPRVAVDGRL